MATEKISLFSRLSLRQKFGILAVLAFTFTGVAFYAYLTNQQAKIDVIKKEQHGLNLAKGLLALLQSLPRHRGSSTALLNGNTAMLTEEQETKALVEKQIAAFDATRKTLKDQELQKTWGMVLTEWPKIAQKSTEHGTSAAENFLAHTLLIAKVLDTLDLLVDEFGLSLDPNAESYFLMRAALVESPALTEYLGQARGWGTSLLAKATKPITTVKEKGQEPVITYATLTLQERGKLSLMTSIASTHLSSAIRDFDKAAKYNPHIQAPLAAPLKNASELAAKALNLSEAEIISKTSPTYNSTEYYKQYTQAIDSMFVVIDTGLKELDGLFNQQIKAATEDMLNLSITISGLVLLSALVAMAVASSITRPVRYLVEVMQKLATGDTTVRARLNATDEIGMLAQQFDELIDQRETLQTSIEQENNALNNSIVDLLLSVAKLAQKDLTVKMAVEENVTGPLADALNLLSKETATVMKQVTKIAYEVADVSRQVEAQAAHVITVAADEKSEVEQAASELDAASAEMRDIAELAATCNKAAEKAIKNTEQAQETVLETVSGITAIRDTIRETEKRIKRLGERSQEIGGVVNLINEIAERTHILALNAAMHAASAGEAGRGFAVVAGEVQKLAENSREATSKISSLVNNIQVETADTVATMNNAISQVVRGTELAQQAGGEMRATRDTTADLVSLVQTIAAGSTKQSEVSQRLVARARQIQKSTEDTFEQLQDQSSKTEHLVGLSEALVSSVSIFTLPEDEVVG